jgi:fructose 5-dehydrogenase small subunit
MADANTRHPRVQRSRDRHPTHSAPSARPARTAQVARFEGRRAWLAGACASAAALAAGATSAGAGAAVATAVSALGALVRATPAYADTQPPAGGGLDAFVALSQKLTGRSGLNPVLAKRAYDALSKADPLFMQNVATLNTWLHTHGGVPSDTVIAALQTDTPALAGTVTAIVRAWYLGLVGEMPHVQVIAYENALMFDPVNDVLTVPSYCRDVPLYWSQKPTNA